ncbi:unnamed protein product [Cyprideis torosa]|uniref:Uncharacterized protein n=1 Tax=Cyprideis torosa TaxID=163714 RepID=A0A7R8WFU9_9CRUS|nr:unnamed protein product [Cyprideis torosa]CAG0892243.1 unnamed protein product [Cyprideis torosa]
MSFQQAFPVPIGSGPSMAHRNGESQPRGNGEPHAGREVDQYFARPEMQLHLGFIDGNSSVQQEKQQHMQHQAPMQLHCCDPGGAFAPIADPITNMERQAKELEFALHCREQNLQELSNAIRERKKGVRRCQRHALKELQHAAIRRGQLEAKLTCVGMMSNTMLPFLSPSLPPPVPAPPPAMSPPPVMVPPPPAFYGKAATVQPQLAPPTSPCSAFYPPYPPPPPFCCPRPPPAKKGEAGPMKSSPFERNCKKNFMDKVGKLWDEMIQQGCQPVKVCPCCGVGQADIVEKEEEKPGKKVKMKRRKVRLDESDDCELIKPPQYCIPLCPEEPPPPPPPPPKKEPPPPKQVKKAELKCPQTCPWQTSFPDFEGQLPMMPAPENCQGATRWRRRPVHAGAEKQRNELPCTVVTRNEDLCRSEHSDTSEMVAILARLLNGQHNLVDFVEEDPHTRCGCGAEQGFKHTSNPMEQTADAMDSLKKGIEKMTTNNTNSCTSLFTDEVLLLSEFEETGGRFHIGNESSLASRKGFNRMEASGFPSTQTVSSGGSSEDNKNNDRESTTKIRIFSPITGQQHNEDTMWPMPSGIQTSIWTIQQARKLSSSTENMKPDTNQELSEDDDGSVTRVFLKDLILQGIPMASMRKHDFMSH